VLLKIVSGRFERDAGGLASGLAAWRAGWRPGERAGGLARPGGPADTRRPAKTATMEHRCRQDGNDGASLLLRRATTSTTTFRRRADHATGPDAIPAPTE